MKNKSITIIGAPSSAGAYGPGQEKAPDALREAGLIKALENNNISVIDKQNITGFRWKVDKENPRAMNLDKVAKVAEDISGEVYECLTREEKILVIGGDCTIELGAVAGCLGRSENIGLIYIDLDTDLNTPVSTKDGALDWMGVAHLLAIPGTEKRLTSLAKKTPMLHPDQVYFFANGNMENFERDIIAKYKIKEIPLQEAAADPAKAAKKICEHWALRFDYLLIHLDVDVLDYNDIQLAENYRRNTGLKMDQLMVALNEFLKMPNWAVLTITEINPDHGENDGSTLRFFSETIAKIIGSSFE